MITDWATTHSEMKCMDCGQKRPVSDFDYITITPWFGDKTPSAWRSKYCRGKCYERRYGECYDENMISTVLGLLSQWVLRK